MQPIYQNSGLTATGPGKSAAQEGQSGAKTCPLVEARDSRLLIHHKLKAATRESHASLEATLPLLDPALTRTTYRQLLEKFFGFYAPLEAAMADIGPKALRAEVLRRSKSRWLVQDLIALDYDLESIAGLPRCHHLPELRHSHQVLGALYVVEGATLGGMLITQRLKHTLGEEAERCSRFFQSYGAEVRPMWDACLTLLAQAASEPGAERQLTRSSCDTFHCFEQWIRHA
jgi:heme oxygenase